MANRGRFRFFCFFFILPAFLFSCFVLFFLLFTIIYSLFFSLFFVNDRIVALLAINSCDNIYSNNYSKKALLLSNRRIEGVKALGVSLFNGDRVFGLYYEFIPAGPFAVITAYLLIFYYLKAFKRSAYFTFIGEFYSVAL